MQLFVQVIGWWEIHQLSAVLQRWILTRNCYFNIGIIKQFSDRMGRIFTTVGDTPTKELQGGTE